MALCLLAGGSALAQNAKRTPMTKERPTAEQMAQRMTDRMSERLDLTEAQTRQIYELNLQQMQQMQAHREQMIANRRAEAEKMKTILTAEQYEEWQQMQGPRCRQHREPCCKDGKKRSCNEPCPKKDRK